MKRPKGRGEKYGLWHHVTDLMSCLTLFITLLLFRLSLALCLKEQVKTICNMQTMIYSNPANMCEVRIINAFSQLYHKHMILGMLRSANTNYRFLVFSLSRSFKHYISDMQTLCWLSLLAPYTLKPISMIPCYFKQRCDKISIGQYIVVLLHAIWELNFMYCIMRYPVIPTPNLVIRVSKWWQKDYFWVSCSFKHPFSIKYANNLFTSSSVRII